MWTNSDETEEEELRGMWEDITLWLGCGSCGSVSDYLLSYWALSIDTLFIWRQRWLPCLTFVSAWPSLQGVLIDKSGKHCQTMSWGLMWVKWVLEGLFLPVLVWWCLSLVSSALPINRASITSYLLLSLQTNLNKNYNSSSTSSLSSLSWSQQTHLLG